LPKGNGGGGNGGGAMTGIESLPGMDMAKLRLMEEEDMLSRCGASLGPIIRGRAGACSRYEGAKAMASVEAGGSCPTDG
jgi:hypothetical protein